MNEIETFVLADRTLEEVVHRIADDQWHRRRPDDDVFATLSVGTGSGLVAALGDGATTEVST